MEFAVIFKDRGRVGRAMKKAQSLLINRKAFYEDAIIEVDKAIQMQFESAGQRFNTPWKALKPATVGRRRGKSDRVLQDTGMLKLRWKYETSRYGALLYEEDKKGLSIGGRVISASFYGEAHHEGLGGLPRRPILPDERDVTQEIRKAFDWHVRNRVKKVVGL